MLTSKYLKKTRHVQEKYVYGIGLYLSDEKSKFEGRNQESEERRIRKE